MIAAREGEKDNKIETNVEYEILYNALCLYLVEICLDSN